MNYILITILIVLVILFLYGFIIYNSFIKLSNKVQEAFSTMDVYLKKRWDLIPNIVETVKGYAKHEKDTLKEVIELRNGNYDDLSQSEKLKANEQINKNITKLMALRESYPELKANENFLSLSEDLKKVEEDIANSRKYYNAVVRLYNNKVEMFPSNLLAFVFGYKTKRMFEANSSERETIKVESIDQIVDSLSSYKPSINPKYSNLDYIIDKYNVDINVNENNTLDITETITAYFNVSKHGIFRTIPLRNEITRLDGTTSTNRTQITNLSVNNEYSTSREEGNYVIKIGSANKTFTGEQTYIIKYTYNLGKDTGKGYDELYYNIIGNEWDTVIGNVSFDITMPKDFDSSKLGFTRGLKGSVNSTNIKYVVNGNKISGVYNGILDTNEGLTVRCELDEGYFVGASLKTNIVDYLMFIIPLLFLLISILLWYLFGHDNQVIETVEFYPPEGFNSLEVGYMYKGKANNKDVVSLLIYLANKGYIKISDIRKSSLLLGNSGFKITKLKDYDGENINEKMFLDGLFPSKKKMDFFDENINIFFENSGASNFFKMINNDEVNPAMKMLSKEEKVYNESNKNDIDMDVNEVTDMDLYDKFYVTVSRILSNINKKENKYKIFEKSVNLKSFIIILLMIISAITTITIPTLGYTGIEGLKLTIFICVIFGIFLSASIFSVGPLLSKIIIFVVISIITYLFLRDLPITNAIINEPIYLFGVLVGLICLIGMIICLKYMPKRTKYGNEILGKIRGFKNFLETAEKEKLEAMVLENPTYFYDILPYTYVLDVSDKWIEKFESISLKSPDWYDNTNAFDIITFGSFISSTMSSAESVMTSSPSSSSSSSFSSSSSGGGSSGGGSGGGGGGSW